MNYNLIILLGFFFELLHGPADEPFIFIAYAEKLFNWRTCTMYPERPRPPDKNAYLKTIFFISHLKHMLWVLKRTVSLRRFF